MKSENKNTASARFVIATFFAILIFVLGMFAGRLSQQSNIYYGLTGNTTTVLDAEYINKILNIINDSHLNGLPTSQDLTYAAVKGIIGGLGDTYSAYYTPEEAKEYLKQIDSNYLGVGIQLEKVAKGAKIKRIFKGSPAERSQLQKDDIIVKVDDKDVSQFSVDEIAKLVRGQVNTNVELTVIRPAGNKEVVSKINRQEIDLENIEFEHLGDSVYAIHIYRFTEGEEGELQADKAFIALWKAKMQELAKLSPKALVIDLRGNPGGFVTAVQYVAEEFLESGKIIMQEQEKDAPREAYRDSRQGIFEKTPLVVLVDEDSASASEIFAAAIQENERGMVLGQRTVGKGVEQRLINQEDGSLLLLVFRKWLTPLGNQISTESPIKPNILLDSEILSDEKKPLQIAKEKLDH
jgi:carboxyl-terminal processing protease